MKKQYIAPDLHFESFVLSQSIAAGCTSIGVTQSYVELGLFSQNVPSNNQGITSSSCTYDYDAWVDEGIIEEYCYWSGSFKLFLS